MMNVNRPSAALLARFDIPGMFSWIHPPTGLLALSGIPAMFSWIRPPTGLLALSGIPAMFIFVSTALAQGGPGGSAPPTPVAVDEVARMEVAPKAPYTGTVQSRNDLQITAAVDGRLDFVAEPGTTVAVGDVVVRVDTRQLDLQKAEQEALAARAQTQLAFLDGQLGRQRDLRERQSVSVNDLEQTETQRELAARDLEIARLRIEQIDEQLRRSVVRAPHAGVVSDRLRREGETVARGTPLARLIDTSNLEVRVLVPVPLATAIRPASVVEVFAFQTVWHGRVRAVIPPLDMRSQSVDLRIDIDGGGPFSVGQLVSVSVPTAPATASLVVPRDALILRQDGTYLFAVNEDGTARRVAVTTGPGVGDRIAVEGDLREGEQVVVRGAETLNEGQQVAIQPAELDSSSATAAADDRGEPLG